MKWLPIETAPKDAPILGWCVHEADEYQVDGILTPYGANVEGMGHAGDGPQIVIWGDDYHGTEDEGYGHIPAWWVLNDDDFCTPANPTHWLPIPPDPTKGEQNGI